MEEEKKACKALDTPYQVSPLTYTRISNHSPPSAAWYLPNGVTMMELFIEHKILGGTQCHDPSATVLLPAPTWGGCAAPSADSGHILKSNPTRSCLCNPLLRPKSVFLQFPPSHLHGRAFPAIHDVSTLALERNLSLRAGKVCPAPAAHTALSQQMDTVKGLSPAPQSRLISSRLK